MTIKNFIAQSEHSLEAIAGEFPPLPRNWRQNLANWWPWIALVSGILQISAAYTLWHLTRFAEVIVRNAELYSTTYVAAGPSIVEKLAIYLGLVTLAVEGTVLLLAFSPLKKKMRKGWDLVFLAALINLAYAITAIFITERGIGSSFGSLLVSALGFYLLFQIKDYFYHPTTPSTSTQAAHKTSHK